MNELEISDVYNTKKIMDKIRNKDITSEYLIYLLVNHYNNNGIHAVAKLLNYECKKKTFFGLICRYQPFETIRFIFNNFISEDRSILRHTEKWFGYKPLHIILRYQDLECVEFVFNHPTMKLRYLYDNDKFESTPIHIACYYAPIEIIKFIFNHDLITSDLLLNQKTDNRVTALHFVCHKQSRECVEFAVNHYKITQEHLNAISKGLTPIDLFNRRSDV